MLQRIQNRGKGRRHERERRAELVLWKVEKGIQGVKGLSWRGSGRTRGREVTVG